MTLDTDSTVRLNKISELARSLEKLRYENAQLRAELAAQVALVEEHRVVKLIDAQSRRVR